MFPTPDAARRASRSYWDSLSSEERSAILKERAKKQQRKPRLMLRGKPVMTPDERRLRLNAQQRARRLANPERTKEIQRRSSLKNWEKRRAAMTKWKEAHRDDQRNYYVARQYGLTSAQVAEMHAAQKGLCAICGCPEIEIVNRGDRTRRLAIDHDHVTGQIRGLLCHRCNRAIGLMREDVGYVHAAARYLERFKSMPYDFDGHA